ncbi:PhoX family protein [Qipengyuania sp. 1XM1-15A]|uniref:alkaline phosphatase PhoX n=1 Tax=Qipengyuania xiamenensis TaxID=2867237 RepID=UPI001C876078|nr:alkaline phosphatase PhoX [Qipengyuania xiamenensis]MBX7532985.1 PhoX family protein [Qipengyuania xiamenensis]
MTADLHRRQFLSATASAFAALSLSGCQTRVGSTPLPFTGYGELVPDPNGMLNLPEGFSYRLISAFGHEMDDGEPVPDAADGMGCIPLSRREIALVRNHELMPGAGGSEFLETGFDKVGGQAVLPGGTTTIVLDAKTLRKKREYRSLAGTMRNCAGGVTPWGSWLTCEEFVTTDDQIAPDKLAKHHGWIFEVPADAGKQINPEPLKAMGRFNHEAACVDPETGLIYLTEDRTDSALYRFVPKVPGDLAQGGELQAMRIAGLSDTRNWAEAAMPVGTRYSVDWITLDNVEAPLDDLRTRAAAQGAAIIARGEGIHMGLDELFICSTSGGAMKLGQIFKLVPGRNRKPDEVELFFESESKEQFNYGDNLVVAPNGHLIVCEDQYTEIVDNRLILITPKGEPHVFGRLTMQTELAGGCFSPDGKWFFVNAYSPTRTFAITGPWYG